MPCGRVSRILRLVKDCDRDRVTFLVVADKRAPAPSSRPGSVALDAFAREVLSRGIRRGACGLGFRAVRVRVDAPAGGWRFKPARNAHPEHAILLILEDHVVRSEEHTSELQS